MVAINQPQQSTIDAFRAMLLRVEPKSEGRHALYVSPELFEAVKLFAKNRNITLLSAANTLLSEGLVTVYVKLVAEQDKSNSRFRSILAGVEVQDERRRQSQRQSPDNPSQ